MLRWQIGDVRVTQIVELTTASLGKYVVPDATPEVVSQIGWLAPFCDDEHRIVLSMHSLVVESQGQTIMVDTCIGNDKPRQYPRWNYMQGNYLDKLSAAGFSPERIDTVLCTHMHVDHVGWNTRLVDDQWVATFANARYLYAQEEYEHWRHEPEEEPVFEDSVKPIFDLGLADLVPSNHAVNDEVTLIPTPGHTPGHVSIHIRSRGEEAIITGDMIHHPCQIHAPHWGSPADTDTPQAIATRASFLAQYADEPVLILGTHFAGPGAGHIVRDGDVYRLDY